MNAETLQFELMSAIREYGKTIGFPDEVDVKSVWTFADAGVSAICLARDIIGRKS